MPSNHHLPMYKAVGSLKSYAYDTGQTMDKYYNPTPSTVNSLTLFYLHMLQYHVFVDSIMPVVVL